MSVVLKRFQNFFFSINVINLWYYFIFHTTAIKNCIRKMILHFLFCNLYSKLIIKILHVYIYSSFISHVFMCMKVKLLSSVSYSIIYFLYVMPSKENFLLQNQFLFQIFSLHHKKKTKQPDNISALKPINRNKLWIQKTESLMLPILFI